MSHGGRWRTVAVSDILSRMIVIFHVVIALLGLIVTTLAYIQPSIFKLHAAYGLVAMTLVTGIYLVAISPAHMIQACTAGLVYVGIASIGIVGARVKMAAALKDNA